MFIKNDIDRRWVNGTLGRIYMADEDTLMVELESGEKHVLDPAVWRNIKYEYDEKNHKVIEKELGSFIQYPVKLAWALTIHKSQGLTFNDVVIDIGRGTFSGGQAYVYIYDQEAGAARKAAIEDGLIGSERIQVLSGLDYSDQVITTWTKELYEGAPVQLAEGSGTDAETSLDGGESAGAGESPEAGNGEAPMTDAPGEPAADAAAGDAEAPEPAAEETSTEETSANAQ